MIVRQAIAVALGLVLAVLLGYGAVVEGLPALAVLVIAAVPLVGLALPAGLMLGATLRHGDPYDVRHRYPPGAYLGRSVGPHE